MDYTNIESKRLYYRPFTNDDYDVLKEVLGDRVVCLYLPGETPFSDEVIHKWLDFYVKSFDTTKPNMIYALVNKETNEFMGYAGLAWVREFEKNEIMFAFSKRFWGKGYATEASARLKKLAEDIGLKELIALADVRNRASQRVLEKIGYDFVKEMDIWESTMKYYEMELKK